MVIEADSLALAGDHWLDRWVSWCNTLTQPIAFIGVLGMLIASGVTVVDVILRYAFASGIVALNEITAMAFTVAVTACIPCGMAQGVSLAVDVLEPRLAPRTAALLKAAGATALFVFLAILAWRMTLFAQMLRTDGRTTQMLSLSYVPFMGGAALMLAIGSVVQIVVAANAWRKAFVVIANPGPKPRSALGFDIAILILLAITVAIAVVCIVNFGAVQRWAQAHTTMTVFIALLLMWAFLMMLIPLAAVLGIMGLVGCALIIGFQPAYSAMVTEMLGFLSNYQIAVLPLFLMMGSFAAASGIADDAYMLAHSGLGRFRGGLAMATIGGCAALGAVTGSSVATAAAVGRVALPEMRARGYSDALSSGSIAAGGTLGNFVPPGSGPLVLFALMTEASIGQLFVASVIPALLVTIAYLICVVVFVRCHPESAPQAVPSKPGEFWAALRRCGPLFTLFVGVLGGMYIGLFTPTEAAAAGAFGAFLTAVWRGKIRPANFWAVMGETTQVTAMVYSLIFGALTFAFFCEVTGIAEQLTRGIRDLGWPPIVLIAMLLGAFIMLGTFMDSYTVMIVTIPIVTPIILASGYDIVWWGIINLFVVEIGAISPPFGLNMFVLKSIGDVDLGDIFYGSTWFCIAAILTLGLLVIFPQLSLWLPSTMWN